MRDLSRVIIILLLTPVFVLAQEKVNINTATLEQLQSLTGIGPVYGQRIIDARPFFSLDDLIKINGIGEKTLQKIKDQGLAYVEELVPAEDPVILVETPVIPEEIILEEPSQYIVYPKNIIFIEILPSPEGPDDENEYIKIHNNNNFEVDLFNWVVKDEIGKTTEYTLSTKIAALSSLTLKRPDTKITLNNDGDKLMLLDPNKEIVDSVEFEKAVQGESYVKNNSSWTWTISEIKQSSSRQKSENIITNQEANINSKTIPLKRTSSSPLLTASIVALLSGIAFLIVKSNLKTFWY